MEVTVACPGCEAALPVQGAEAPAEIACGSCRRAIPLRFSDAVTRDQSVDACPVCEGRDFYIRKDFDPKLGLAFVVVGATISAVFYGFGMDLVAYGVLALAVLIDLAVYRRLGDVTVCYRCHAEFRGQFERTAGAFDLHTADELEAEYAKQTGRR
jgi:hypothetical protein